jgi:hypothetical protein
MGAMAYIWFAIVLLGLGVLKILDKLEKVQKMLEAADDAPANPRRLRKCKNCKRLIELVLWNNQSPIWIHVPEETLYDIVPCRDNNGKVMHEEVKIEGYTPDPEIYVPGPARDLAMKGMREMQLNATPED